MIRRPDVRLVVRTALTFQRELVGGRALFDLTGKVVVVTGGGRGIGLGISRSMAECGASVVVAGRNPTPLRDAVNDIRMMGAVAMPVVTDIGDKSQIDRLVRTTLSEFGVIDCWVNNAGGAKASDVGPLIDLNEAQWDAVVDLNLKHTFFAAQAAGRAMAGRGGSIVNISSSAGSRPCPMTGHYGAAKAAVESLTGTMAAEWGHHYVRVNAVAPGLVRTEDAVAPGGALSRPSVVARQTATVPLRRLGTPQDIGAVCAFLASDEASWLTGETIQVTGGSSLSIGYLTYMHHVTTELEKEASAIDKNK